MKAARSVGGFALKIEVECRSVEEALEACQAGADVVMLDNFEPCQLAVDAPTIKAAYPHVKVPTSSQVLIEASGGITLQTLRQYCVPTVDVLSMGALTQGYAFVDFSLKINR